MALLSRQSLKSIASYRCAGTEAVTDRLSSMTICPITASEQELSPWQNGTLPPIGSLLCDTFYRIPKI